jgi:DNA-directed RNA polymerase specialized sigma24 family protein
MDNVARLGQLARKGDEAAYDKLYDLLYPRVYSYVARYIPQRLRVEGIVEDVLCLSMLSIGSIVRFQEPREVLRFVFDITRERVATERSIVKKAS